MAKVWVGFYRECMTDKNGHPIAVPKEPPLGKATIDTASGEAHTPAAPENATMVAIYCDAAVHLAVNEDAIADETDRPRGAGQTEYLGIQAGHRVSALTKS